MFTKNLLLAAAAFAGVASAATCPTTEFSKLVPLASDANLTTCKNDSGYNFLAPTGLPTSDQVALMCKSTACVALIGTIKGLSPSDCELSLGTTSINVYQLVSSFDGDCAALTTPAITAPAETMETPTVTTATPSETTATPSETTEAPTAC